MSKTNEMSALLTSMREKWYKDRADNPDTQQNPEKIDKVEDSKFYMDELEDMNQNTGDHFFDSMVDHGLNQNDLRKHGSKKPHKDKLMSSVNRLLATKRSAKTSDQSKKPNSSSLTQKLEMFKSKQRINAKKAGRSGGTDHLIRIQLELKKLHQPDSESKLQNQITTLERRFFWDNDQICTNQNKMLTDPNNSKLIQYWKLYTFQNFQDAKSIKSQANDVKFTSETIRKGQNPKVVRNFDNENLTGIVIKQIRNPGVGWTQLVECNYEENHTMEKRDGKIAALKNMQMPNIGTTAPTIQKKRDIKSSMKSSLGQTKKSVIIQAGDKNDDKPSRFNKKRVNNDKNGNEIDTSADNFKKPYHGSEEGTVKQVGGDLEVSQVIPENEKKEIEKKMKEEDPPEIREYKRKMWEEFHAEADCNKKYDINGLSQVCKEYMKSFTKNFVVDPYFNMEILLEDSENFQDFDQRKIDQYREKKVVKCCKKNAYLRTKVAEKVDDSEAKRAVKLSQLYKCGADYQQLAGNYDDVCDSNGNRRNSASQNSTDNDNASQYNHTLTKLRLDQPELHHIAKKLKQNIILFEKPTKDDLKAHLKNPLLIDAKDKQNMNKHIAGALVSGIVIDKNRKERDSTIFNNAVGITWKGYAAKQIGKGKKFHDKFFIMKKNWLLWMKKDSDKEAKSCQDQNMATMKDVFELIPGVKAFSQTGRKKDKILTIQLKDEKTYQLKRLIQSYLVNKSIKDGLKNNEIGMEFNNLSIFYGDEYNKEFIFEQVNKIRAFPYEVIQTLRIRQHLTKIEIVKFQFDRKLFETLSNCLYEGLIRLDTMIFDDTNQTESEIKSLDRYQQSEISNDLTTISFKKNMIKDDGVIFILENLIKKLQKYPGYYQKRLDFSHTKITDKTAFYCKQLLQNYPDRDQFDLDISNNLQTKNGILYLCEETSKYRAVCSLIIDNNDQSDKNLLKDFIRIGRDNNSLAEISCTGRLMTDVNSLFSLIKFMFRSPSCKSLKLNFKPQDLSVVDFEMIKKGLKFFQCRPISVTDTFVKS